MMFAFESAYSSGNAEETRLDAGGDGGCAGLDRSNLAAIEEGKRNVCLRNLKVISIGLGLSLSKLFSRV